MRTGNRARGADERIARKLLRSGDAVLQRRRALHDVSGGSAGADPLLQQHLPVRLPPSAGRRHHRGDPRLAGRTQPPQAADQGRHPLRPGRPRRGSDGAGRPHDLQVRHRRRALRRRQGRHQDRAQELHRRGTRADHAALHPRAGQEGLHRPRHRRAGAGLRHRRTRDGVDRRHLRGDASRAARRHRLRDRQAAHARRRQRPPRGHRARPVLRHPRGLLARRRHAGARPHDRPRGQARGRAGTRQRRLSRGEVLPRGRRAGRRHRRTRGRHSQSQRPARRRGVPASQGRRVDPHLPRRHAAGQHRRGARTRVRHPDSGGAREPVHRRQRAAHQGEDHPRRRQRPDDARRRSDLPAEGRSWSSPTSTPTPAASRCRTSSG